MEERRRSKRYCNITLLACGSGVKEEEGGAVGRQKSLPPFPSPPLTPAAKANRYFEDNLGSDQSKAKSYEDHYRDLRFKTRRL